MSYFVRFYRHFRAAPVRFVLPETTLSYSVGWQFGWQFSDTPLAAGPAPYVWGKSSAPLDHDLEWPWSRAQLLKMDSRIRAAMERAINLGLERRSDDDPTRAA